MQDTRENTPVTNPDLVPPQQTEAVKSGLPAGVTQDQIDRWKQQYGELRLVTVAGIRLIIRALSYVEFRKIQETSSTQETMTEAILDRAVLFRDKTDKTPSGFRIGVANAVADISLVDQGLLVPLHQEEQFETERWETAMSQYDEPRRIPLDKVHQYRDEGRDLWLYITPKVPFLMTSINQDTYEKIMEASQENYEIRMIQEAVLAPQMFSNAINQMPYGLILGLHSRTMVTSGFSPEQSVVL